MVLTEKFEIIFVFGKLWSLDTMSSVNVSTYILKEKEKGKFYWYGSDVLDKFGEKPLKLFFTSHFGSHLIDLQQFEHWDDDLYLSPMVESEHTVTDLKTLTEVI